MLGAVLQLTLPAIALAIERDGPKRNQQVMEEQHDIGPWMPNDKSVPMLELTIPNWQIFPTILK